MILLGEDATKLLKANKNLLKAGLSRSTGMRGTHYQLCESLSFDALYGPFRKEGLKKKQGALLKALGINPVVQKAQPISRKRKRLPVWMAP